MSRKISKDKEDYIVQNYFNKPTKEIKEYTGLPITTIMRVLKRNNLKNKTSKLYTCDENFFENIDTEEKAYWLGFIYADGYVRIRKSGSELRVKLSIKDLEHLKKFKETLNSNGDIKFNQDEAILGIYSRKLVKDLIDKGCHQAKTFTIEFPYFLDKNLVRHFIRGYFDGDGNLKCNILKRSFSLNFVCGSLNFLNSIKDELSTIIGDEIEVYHYNENKFHRIFINSIPNIINVYYYIYKNSNVYLDRKKQNFLKIIDYVKTTKKTNRRNVWKLTEYIMGMQ